MFALRTLTALAVVIAAVSGPAEAQSLGDRLKKKAKEKVEQKTNQTMDRAVDGAATKAENTVKCAVTDTACAEKARAEGKTVVTDDTAPPAAASSMSAAPSKSSKPGEGAWVNYDFVPGDRPLFVEDFMKDNVGDFPKRFEFVDGNMEVAEWNGARFVRVTSWPGEFAIVLPEALPERFTMEFDATPGYSGNDMIMKFGEKAQDEVRFRRHSGKGQGGVFSREHQSLGMTPNEIGENELFHGRIMADGKYVKVYINDTRVANIPNAELGRSNKIRIYIPGKEDHPVFFGNVSIMAGGRKLYDALEEKGRVATQGIFFDTGSDRIRPESTPTLKEIGAMLKEHAELKLVIEGHTDNVGQAAANQALSEKRAAAVKQFLVDSYGIDAARLESKGLGASKPAAPNTTNEGRQTNRRVELVKA
jgi:outer membrane protein OmpA-like peptidoglycan-associated protein